MWRIFQFVLLALLSTLSAWSQARGKIFVYAPRETGTRSWQAVWCDGDLVANIKRGTFFALSLAPGRHVLQQSDGVSSVVEVRRGDEKFMRLGLQMELGQPAVRIFDKVDPAVAGNELRFVSFIDAKQVFSSSVSKSDPRQQVEPHLKVRSEGQ